jgi:hypothetical protein
MLNPATPPNGAGNYYLIPSLGIIPWGVVSAVYLWDNWGGPAIYPYLQNRGIIWTFLATQDYYEYLTTTVTECLFDPYTVTPPSMLNAPLDVAVSGTPPALMTDFPGGGDFNFPGWLIILEAIELTPGRHNWVYLGEDAGLDTVTGILLGANKWVGDTVRVRIRSIDTGALNDPTHNWEGIYSVTLQPIDPFFDSLFVDALASYVSYLRINTTTTPTPTLYLDPAATMPIHMRGHRRGKGRDPSRGLTHVTRRKGSNRNAISRDIVMDIPQHVDIFNLPTLGEDYRRHALSKRGAAPPSPKVHAPPPSQQQKKRQQRQHHPVQYKGRRARASQV